MVIKLEFEVDDSLIKEGVLKDLNVSIHARLFDSDSCLWANDLEYNRSIVRRQEDYFNSYLRHDGILFLNEVYRAFGFRLSKAGQVFGWIYNKDKPLNIDIITDGESPDLLLDFNVDGEILSKI